MIGNYLRVQRAPLMLSAIVLRGLLILVGSVAVSVGSASAAVELEDVELAMARGDHRAAEQLAGELIGEQPGLADAYRLLADALVAQGRESEALGPLMEAGVGLLRAGAPAEALTLLERVGANYPSHLPGKLALGEARLRNRDHPGAVEAFQSAWELGERGGALRLMLATSLWESGDFAGSEKVLRRAIQELGPALPLLRTLGSFLLWSGRYEEAVTVLEQARAAGAKDSEVMRDLARALAGARRYESANQLYQQLEPQLGGEASFHYERGRVYQSLSRREEAERSLESFARLHAEEQAQTRKMQREGAALDQAWSLVRRGEYDPARKLLEPLSTSVEVLLARASISEALGERDAALRALQRAVQLKPEDPMLKLELERLRIAER